MDELGEIRERIAQRTEARRTAWLKQQRRRYVGWLVTAAVLAGLVMVVAGLAKSIAFGVAAVYLWLFACNRWMEHRRVKQWLLRPMPMNDSERFICAQIFYDEMSHPPVWLRVSNWIAAITGVAGGVAVSAVIIATSGLWIRLLWGLAYGLVALHIFAWVCTKLRYLQQLKAHRALGRARWSDLT